MPLNLEELKSRIGQEYDGELHLTEEEGLALISRVEELEKALNRLTSAAACVDLEIGWRGTKHENTEDLYGCEFCGAVHEDWTIIPHEMNCAALELTGAITCANGVLRRALGGSDDG